LRNVLSLGFLEEFK
jgi:hypothetical protein